MTLTLRTNVLVGCLLCAFAFTCLQGTHGSGGGGGGHGAEAVDPAAAEAALIRRKIENPPLKDVAAMVDRGDAKAANHDFQAARRDYEAAVKMSPAPSAAVHARIGFCAEQIGDTNQALAAYREAIKKGDSPLADFAALSQARVWSMVDNIDMAFELAAPLALGPNFDAEASRQIAEEAQLLSCYLRSRQACDDEPKNLLNDRGMAFPSPPNSAETQWKLLLAAETASDQPAAKPGDAMRTVQRTTDGLDGHYVQGALIDIPVAQVLEQLAGLAERNIQIAPGARQILAERKMTQDVPEIRLDRLLTAVCERYGLLWQEDVNDVVILEPGELPLQELRDYRKRAARLSIDDYLAVKGHHSAANHLKLLGGNLAFLSGDYQGAVSRFESLQKLRSSRTLNAAAMFNLAKTQLAMKDRARAMACFYDSIDAEVPEYMGPCYLYIGRMLLEDNQNSDALKAFHRALTHTGTIEQRRHATLCLSMAQLASDNPYAASKLLFDSRSMFESAPEEIPYIFMSALANSSVAKDQKLRHELKQLASLSGYVTPDSFFGATGYRPIAMAYDRLELLDDWRAISLKALEDPRLQNSRYVFYAQLGEVHRRSGDFEQAVKYLQASSQVSDPKWRSSARDKIIQIAFAFKQDDLCVRECLLALKEERSPESRQAVLRTLGKTYERQGNRKLAVRCLVGVAPDETLTDDDRQEGTVQ